LRQMMLDAGFDEVAFHNLAAGVVAVHVGRVY
jgi:ubiquinone/menaquinone biosynthesis C-methylase UbiE